MNSINLSGRLVYEPEIKKTQNGTAFISNRIAVSRNDKNKTTDFFNVRIWDKTADFVVKYFHKGDPIEISGKLQNDNYEKQDGTKVNDVVIFVNEVNFTLSKASATAPAPVQAPAPAQAEPSELPFEI